MKRIIMLLYVAGFVVFLASFAQATDETGAVYAMTNADDGNEIVVYNRAANGGLVLVGTFATGGLGKTTEPDDALGAQNPLILSPDHRWLFAVNAGSHTISVFEVEPDGLIWVQEIDSGGDFPVSLTLSEDRLYVLNAGGDGNISGFSLHPSGPLTLTPLPGSTRSLNAGGTNPPFFLDSPAQVGFNPFGDKLLVSVKGALTGDSLIHVFSIDGGGLPSPQSITTASNVSFGFVFADLDHLVVAEPFGSDPPGAKRGAAASYRIDSNGSLVPISPSVPNKQTATCWIAITTDMRFAYTTNNVSGTISSYDVHEDGSLSLMHKVAAAIGDDAAPVDLAITPDNHYLYNVNAGHGTVSMFEIDQTKGDLMPLGEISGLPTDGSAVGMAVY